jgi:hypothetical protein
VIQEDIRSKSKKESKKYQTLTLTLDLFGIRGRKAKDGGGGPTCGTYVDGEFPST